MKTISEHGLRYRKILPNVPTKNCSEIIFQPRIGYISVYLHYWYLLTFLNYIILKYPNGTWTHNTTGIAMTGSVTISLGLHYYCSHTYHWEDVISGLYHFKPIPKTYSKPISSPVGIDLEDNMLIYIDLCSSVESLVRLSGRSL